jgi:hypothetical protein
MIDILPESRGNLVAVRMGGTLTTDDYTGTWVPRLREVFEEHGKARTLIYLDETFEGWEAGVIWEDTKFGLTHFTDFDKIAIVGAEKWVGQVAEFFGKLMPASVKSFPAGSLEEAYEWIK